MKILRLQKNREGVYSFFISFIPAVELIVKIILTNMLKITKNC